LRREARNYFGYFVWKITILRQKIIFFPILGGRPLPPWIRPCKKQNAKIAKYKDFCSSKDNDSEVHSFLTFVRGSIYFIV
jgi:hypothetical protein